MNEHVVLYMNPECPNCAQLKAYLQSQGIEYEQRDITKDRSVRQRMVDETGSWSVPTLCLGEMHLIGYEPDKITQAVSDWKKQR